MCLLLLISNLFHYQLNEGLESSRTEVARLHQERDRYEETMKKAFMRGVCALNLEAMGMFHEQEEKGRYLLDFAFNKEFYDEFEWI